MRAWLLILPVFWACSLPSPEAPSWEVTGTVPMVAKTVFVREVAESEDEFFFGDYGPWRFMDTDSVLASILTDSMRAEESVLRNLPSDMPADIFAGPIYWGGNPLDEIENPSFYRAWLELELSHNLPGSLSVAIAFDGWDDQNRPCGPVFLNTMIGASVNGEIVSDVAYAPSEEVLSFVNPSGEHAVPDSFTASCVTTFLPNGSAMVADPFLSYRVSLITALDLSFETTVVAKRAEIKELIIAPEGEDSEDAGADVSGDLTEKLREMRLRVEVDNNLPVGGIGLFKMAHDTLSLRENPELSVGPFTINAAPIDPITGKPIGVTPSVSEAILDEADLLIFENPGPGNDTLFASIEYTLEGTGARRVCIAAPDSVRLRSVGIVQLLVDPSEED